MAIGLKIIDGDFIVDSGGIVQMLTPAEKCSRDIGKLLITKSEYMEMKLLIVDIILNMVRR